MNRRLVEQVLVALLLCTAILPACRGRRDETEGVQHLTAVVLPYLTFAPIYIAEDEGFFREQRLEVEFVRLVKVAEGIPSLAQGRVDVLGGSVSTGFLNAVARGARIRAVASKGYVA